MESDYGGAVLSAAGEEEDAPVVVSWGEVSRRGEEREEGRCAEVRSGEGCSGDGWRACFGSRGTGVGGRVRGLDGGVNAEGERRVARTWYCDRNFSGDCL